MLERIAFVNSRNLTLVGNLQASGSKSIIILSHGMASDKSWKGRFNEISDSLYQANFSTFAFDFSGCGESDNDSITISKEVDDLNSAIKFVKARGYNQIALFGYSLGSLICIKCYTPTIKTMVLVGAITGSIKYDWRKVYSDKQMNDAKKYGQFTDKVDSPWRKEVIVDKRLLWDLKHIKQEDLLSKVKCPTLLIHGDGKWDEEERLLLEKSQQGIRYFSMDTCLEVIHGADHSFHECLGEVIQLTKDWFVKYFEH